MNEEVKKKWVAALRSGEYKQGKDQLKTERYGECTYCCLGVLCDLFAKETNTSWDNKILSCDLFMPTTHIREWAGVSSNDDFSVKVDDPSIISVMAHGKIQLYVLNDKYNYSFAQIADLIEKYL